MRSRFIQGEKTQIKLENKTSHVEVENVNVHGAKYSYRSYVSHVFPQLISVSASRRRTRCNNNTISAVNTRDVMSRSEVMEMNL